MRKKNLLISFFVSLIIFLTLISASYAQEKFISSCDSTYTVYETGNTNILLSCSLENTTDRFRPSAYSLQVGYSDLENVTASDPDGFITPVIEDSNGKKTIAITFNSKIVGLGKKLPFKISFNSKDVTQKNGRTWEVHIPGIANQNNFSNYSVTVHVPPSFGNPTYIKPSQFSNNLYFTKDNLGSSGIAIGFGDKQLYSFNLTYHLENKNIFPVQTEIALPPQTNYQDVFLETLSPSPLNVYTDKDGNWLAKYQLSAKSKTNVVAIGKVLIYLNPFLNQSSDNLSTYLSEKPYWQVTSKSIQDLAVNLKTPSAIFDYVVKTLTYDFSRVTSNQQRLGAVSVLQNPTSAVCLEFTDLFVTLARAAGIPAREIDGFAYTQNSKDRPLSFLGDILHAWPEYYDNDKKQWIMVDPTWQNTTKGVDYFHTLDVDHITLAIRGLSSNYPIPAGGYKTTDNESSKDVLINFSDSDIPPITELVSFSTDLNSTFFSGLPINGNIKVKNIGSYPISPQKISVLSENLLPKTQELDVPEIPPFGFIDIPLSFEKTSFLTNTTDVIKIQLGQKFIEKNVTILPFFLSPIVLVGGGLFVIISIILYIIAKKTWSLLFSR